MLINMSLSNISNRYLHTIARWMLLLFILAWVNLVYQAPVHAAMKQAEKEMPCHCQPKLCDTVLSMERQSDEGLSLLFSFSLDFKVAFVSLLDIQPLAGLTPRHWQYAHQYRQTSPPPLLLNTVLLI